MMVIIDGMRSWEEYLYLKEKFPKVKLVILAIYADKDIRYERLNKRKYRRNLGGETRDINELLGTNMGPTIAFADYLIKNNYSLEEFYDKLDEFYRIVYFS
jgi:dephospho-CoA kinase